MNQPQNINYSWELVWTGQQKRPINKWAVINSVVNKSGK